MRERMPAVVRREHFQAPSQRGVVAGARRRSKQPRGGVAAGPEVAIIIRRLEILVGNGHYPQAQDALADWCREQAGRRRPESGEPIAALEDYGLSMADLNALDCMGVRTILAAERWLALSVDIPIQHQQRRIPRGLPGRLETALDDWRTDVIG